MKYIKLFKNDVEYQAFRGGGDYITPNLCLNSETWETKCEPENALKPINTLTFIPYVDVKWGMLSIQIYAEYQVTSNIDVCIKFNSSSDYGPNEIKSFRILNGIKYVEKTDIAAAENAEIEIISITPKEDDTYIYNIVVQYN